MTDPLEDLEHPEVPVVFFDTRPIELAGEHKKVHRIQRTSDKAGGLLESLAQLR